MKKLNSKSACMHYILVLISDSPCHEVWLMIYFNRNKPPELWTFQDEKFHYFCNELYIFIAEILTAYLMQNITCSRGLQILWWDIRNCSETRKWIWTEISRVSFEMLCKALYHYRKKKKFMSLIKFLCCFLKLFLFQYRYSIHEFIVYLLTILRIV